MKKTFIQVILGLGLFFLEVAILFGFFTLWEGKGFLQGFNTILRVWGLEVLIGLWGLVKLILGGIAIFIIFVVLYNIIRIMKMD